MFVDFKFFVVGWVCNGVVDIGELVVVVLFLSLDFGWGICVIYEVFCRLCEGNVVIWFVRFKGGLGCCRGSGLCGDFFV